MYIQITTSNSANIFDLVGYYNIVITKYGVNFVFDCENI